LGAVLLTGFIVLAARGFCPAADALPDPVTRLQDALQVKGDLSAAAAEIKSLGDLSHALLLKEWHGTGAEVPVRNNLADRFQKGVQQVVSSGSLEERLAVARLMGEIGITARNLSLDRPFFRGLLARLTPDLIQLTKPSQPVSVRQAAAQSLGQVEGEIKLLEPAFKSLLALDNPPEVRVATAEAFGNILQIAYKELTREATGASLSAARESSRLPKRIDLVQRARLILPLASAGLDVRQPAAVRLASIEDYRILTTALADAATDLSTPESPLLIGLSPEEAEKERQRIETNQKQLNAELQGLFQDFHRQAPVLAAASLDANPEVRVAARRVLENLAYVRRQFAGSFVPPEPVPEKVGEPRKVGQLPGPSSSTVVVVRTEAVAWQKPAEKAPEALSDPLQEALRQTLPALRKGLTDPDPKARLAAVAVLEAMAKDAEPVIPSLVERLTDSDRFVRWAAARALGKMAPLRADLVVPRLGFIVANPQGDLGPRLAAAQALENYGPDARAALASLREVVRRGFVPQASPWPVAHTGQPVVREVYRGEADLRVAAMRALRSIGSAAEPAIPDFGQTLATDPDPRVRRVAAEVLGAFGAKAQTQAAILRNRLNDPDPEVRLLTSEALLKILGK
jgi:HEAT repeat protein